MTGIFRTGTPTSKRYTTETYQQIFWFVSDCTGWISVFRPKNEFRTCTFIFVFVALCLILSSHLSLSLFRSHFLDNTYSSSSSSLSLSLSLSLTHSIIKNFKQVL